MRNTRTSTFIGVMLLMLLTACTALLSNANAERNGSKRSVAPTPTPDPLLVTAVSAGFDHSLALTQDGSVWAWGGNEEGQLGHGDRNKRLIPERIASLSGVTAISAGMKYSLAITADGSVWGWGASDRGQLGPTPEPTPRVLLPGKVQGIEKVTSVVATVATSMAIRHDGTVWTWGAHDQGLLGTDEAADRPLPTRIQIIRDAVALTSRGFHAVALDSKGALWGWGSNRSIQLGKVDPPFFPKPHNCFTDPSKAFTSVAAGSFTLFTRKDGTVWMMGWSTINRTGNGSDPRKVWYKGEHQQVDGLPAIASATCHDHALALDKSGVVWAWGENMLGQCGVGSQQPVEWPEKVTGLSGIVAIAAGRRFSLAIDKDGGVWGWGDNSNGQLGDATVREKLVPIRVMELGPAKKPADKATP